MLWGFVGGLLRASVTARPASGNTKPSETKAAFAVARSRCLLS